MARPARLYPVDYRYMPKHQRFQKYQWIEVELEKPPANKDNRKESYRPVLESIRVLGEPLSTKNDWRERRQLIDSLPHHTVNELKAAWDVDRVSLGIVRPTRVIDMEIRKVDSEWKPAWKNLFAQGTLFGPERKDLRKLPYSFHYVFECEDSDKPHTAMCEDWELGALFLKESQKLGSDEMAAESVKKKFLGDLCHKDRDTRFLMGTRFPHNTWLVLGVFWPPRVAQRELFS